jgi:hypothetical protein
MSEENTTPTLQELQGKTVTIQGKEYRFDSHRLKWGQICDLRAELKSGMVAKYYADSGESEMTFTKEYALKEGLVKNKLATILFALDINLLDLEAEEVDPIMEIVDQSNFMKRLEPKEAKKTIR